MKESLDLAEVTGCLDSVALELLKGRFPNVDVGRAQRVSVNLGIN